MKRLESNPGQALVAPRPVPPGDHSDRRLCAALLHAKRAHLPGAGGGHPPRATP